MHRLPISSSRHSSQGYALIVIAALLAAFMAVAGALLESNVADDQLDRQSKARDQLTTLSNALNQYAAFNSNRYPCPARPDLAYGNASFGAAVSSCETGALNTGGLAGISGLPDDTSGSEIIRGMVPVRALVPYGITPEDAFDPWGSRIMYVVNRTLTPGGTGAPTTSPTVTDPVTSTTLGQPDYVLVSYGKDRKGGVVRSQTSTMTATSSCPSASAVLSEENCDNDLTFYQRPLYIAANATSSTYFDDILSYYAGATSVGCAASKASWSTNCSATLTAYMPHGANLTVANTAASYVGSTTVTCANGAYTYSNSSCQPTGANCTWATTYNTWTGTTDCNNITGWASYPVCGTTAPCTVTTTDGTSSTFSAAATACTSGSGLYAAMCRTSTSCTLAYGGSSNTATATMRVCRPDAGCAAGATTWNTNCSGSYTASSVGGTVNVTNTAAGYSGSISGTCGGGGTITWGSGTCSVASCTLPWGGTLASGASVTAYYSSLPTGACNSETRTCTAGTLSGSYTNQACTAGCTAASYTWNTNCNGTFTSQVAGATFTLTNTAANYTGSIGGTCNASGTGVVTWGSGTCTYTVGGGGGGGGGGCFVAGTLVEMADGSQKPIEAIRIGDAVRGEGGFNNVMKVQLYQSDEPIYSFNHGTFFITAEHPVRTTQGWKAIDPELTRREYRKAAEKAGNRSILDTITQLKEGDIIIGANNKKITLRKLVKRDHAGTPQTLYNLSLDGDHTHYANGILVHNMFMVDQK